MILKRLSISSRSYGNKKEVKLTSFKQPHRGGRLSELNRLLLDVIRTKCFGSKELQFLYRKVRTASQNYKKLLIYANIQHEIIVC